MEDIKVALKELGCDGVDWIHLAQDTENRENGNEISHPIRKEFLDD
jgi:hypothetical protein